eukprot:INCI8906.1.p1 GENE.INCI8906.1~~INCI8906.1.p1  ORF type:complete len:345 (+),score=60.52 INCI8906.1:232-1266(+)
MGKVEDESSGGEDSERVTFTLYGMDNSPYSVKVRSYLRYKKLRHEWVVKSFDVQEEFQKLAKLPIVPLIVDPSGRVMQDSTPIIEAIEKSYPTPSIFPEDGALNFVAQLLEEFADEWGNKWMFHYRWARPIDQDRVSVRLAVEMLDAESAADPADVADFAATIKSRMSKRSSVVGSNPTTAPFIERNFRQALIQLEAHFSPSTAAGTQRVPNAARYGRTYIFGSRPCIADFGLASQLYQCMIDPSAGALMQDLAPATCAWCLRVLSGASDGNTVANQPAAFESWKSLAPTLEPFLRCHVRVFLDWSNANAVAIAAKAKELVVVLQEEQLNGVLSEFRWTSTIGG